jgi:simple sugar transport system substrate-binding protein
MNFAIFNGFRASAPVFDRAIAPSLWQSGPNLRRFWPLALLGLALGACTAPSTPGGKDTSNSPKDFTVGMVIVGPKNDAGWNQAHFEGVRKVTTDLNIRLEFADKVNPADRPNITGSQVADELIAKGSKMIIFNSDDFKDDALETAKKHPDIPVIHASGDYAWKEGKNFKNQKNLGNIMGKMEYGKMMTGCAAALGSETGKIGYLGPLINDETRRFATAAYLGAKYCWENYRKKDAAELQFKVTWIGFWFNIPGKTLDPTKVADDYYNGGYDVVISGIDTPEAATQAKKAAETGKKVKYLHYDFKKGCDLVPDICLGVPFYNWALPYEKAIKDAMDGKMPNEFVWLGPNYKDLNDPKASMIGFIKGRALGDKAKKIDEFIAGLDKGTINLYKGPLNFQDGKPFLKAGETVTDQQIWYMPQLLSGMQGASK